MRLPAAIALALIGLAAIVRALRGLAYVHASAATLPADVARDPGAAPPRPVDDDRRRPALILGLVYIGRSSRAEAQGNAQARARRCGPRVTLLVLVLAIVCARQAAAGATLDASHVERPAQARLRSFPPPARAIPARAVPPVPRLSHAAHRGRLCSAVRRVPTLSAAVSPRDRRRRHGRRAPRRAHAGPCVPRGSCSSLAAGTCSWSALVTKPSAAAAEHRAELAGPQIARRRSVVGSRPLLRVIDARGPVH